MIVFFCLCAGAGASFDDRWYVDEYLGSFASERLHLSVKG